MTESNKVTPVVVKVEATPVTTNFINRERKIMKAASIGSSIGVVAGLVYSFKGKKGFWAYVGYALLGSVVLGTVSNLSARALIK